MPGRRLNIIRECTHGGRHVHGTIAAYDRDRCRCDPCSGAKTEWNRRFRKAKAYGRWQPHLIDVAPVTNHMRALRQRGIGYKRVAELAGIGHACASSIVEGRQKTVTREVAGKILAIPLDARTAPRAYIDATGSRRRVQALAAIGWSFPEQVARMGRKQRSGLQKILRGGLTTTVTAEAIRALYDELWDTLPDPQTVPEKIAVIKTRNLAKRKGWAPPLAWDDDAIDDPDAEPYGTRKRERIYRPVEDIVEDVEWLRDTGVDPMRAEERIGITRESLKTALRRHGREDLLNWLRGDAGKHVPNSVRGTSNAA
jgi:hypothetical protein